MDCFQGLRQSVLDDADLQTEEKPAEKAAVPERVLLREPLRERRKTRHVRLLPLVVPHVMVYYVLPSRVATL